ncbi:MAG TPA: TolC family protein [Gemmataceae bacterium]|nr:TolC family protein [Gemmataceae bacterium]
MSSPREVNSPGAEAKSQTAASSDGDPFDGAGELSESLLIDQVLSRNPSLVQMTAAWEAAASRYPQAVSLEDPMFGFTASPSSINSNSVEFGYRLEVSQKLPFSGKRDLRGTGALADADAAARDVDDMKLQLVESAKVSLADYYLAQRALEVNDEGIKLLESFRNRAKDRYEKVPGANEQDILQADVELGRQRQRQIQLERLREVVQARLNTLVHVPPDRRLPPPPQKLTKDEAPGDVAILRQQARAKRPDLLALENRIKADEAALALAEREYWPDFEVGAAYDTIMGNGPTRDLAAQVGIRMNVPIRLSKRDAATAEARARLQQRKAELAKQTDQIHFQVQEAFAQLREANRIVDLYEKTLLPKSKGNVEAAESSYVGGRIPFVSLIEAQRGYVEIQDRYYEALAERFRRQANLERVTGGRQPD